MTTAVVVPGLTDTTVLSAGQVMVCNCLAVPLAEVVVEVATGSLLMIVKVVDLMPALAGVKRAVKSKQAPGAMVTGNPPAGGAIENCEFNDVIELTTRLVAQPLLQTCSVLELLVPTQVSEKAMLLGA